jgi:hypothetical protein
VKRTQRFTIDGKTYDSLDEMPASVREKWDAMVALLASVTADVTANPTKITTFKFGEHIEYGPSGYVRRTGPPITVPVRATGMTRVVGLAIIALLFAVMGLAVFGISTGVRITMIYGPAWWAGAVGVAIGLTAGLAWCGNISQVSTLNNPEPRRAGLRQLIPLSIGMACISLEGILGGLPALAHHMTSRPGSAVVTVAAKKDSSGRYSCRARLVISEFTYGIRNYLCPSDRAFGQIQVGAKVRVEGTVSPFGVEPRYIYWSAK